MTMNKFTAFFKDSIAELKKVVWPSRDEVSASARVVIVSVLVISAILGAIDILLAAVVSAIF
jgi:preprotein translocase subunit SecE